MFHSPGTDQELRRQRSEGRQERRGDPGLGTPRSSLGAGILLAAAGLWMATQAAAAPGNASMPLPKETPASGRELARDAPWLSTAAYLFRPSAPFRMATLPGRAIIAEVRAPGCLFEVTVSFGEEQARLSARPLRCPVSIFGAAPHHRQQAFARYGKSNWSFACRGGAEGMMRCSNGATHRTRLSAPVMSTAYVETEMTQDGPRLEFLTRSMVETTSGPYNTASLQVSRTFYRFRLMGGRCRLEASGIVYEQPKATPPIPFSHGSCRIVPTRQAGLRSSLSSGRII